MYLCYMQCSMADRLARALFNFRIRHCARAVWSHVVTFGTDHVPLHDHQCDKRPNVYKPLAPFHRDTRHKSSRNSRALDIDMPPRHATFYNNYLSYKNALPILSVQTRAGSECAVTALVHWSPFFLSHVHRTNLYVPPIN